MKRTRIGDLQYDEFDFQRAVPAYEYASNWIETWLVGVVPLLWPDRAVFRQVLAFTGFSRSSDEDGHFRLRYHRPTSPKTESRRPWG